jgi:TP901 family phage tail tape measure protein
MAKTLGLGATFTGDASQLLGVINSLIERVRLLREALDTLQKHQGALASKTDRLGKSLLDMDGLNSRLASRLQTQPELLKKAGEATDFLGKKYGTAANEVNNWGRQLLKQVDNMEKMRQSAIASGKNASDYAKTVDYIAKTEEALAGKKEKVASATQKTNEKIKESAKTSQMVISDYGKAQGRASDETAEFRQNLADTTSILGRQGTALKVAETSARRYERAIYNTALRLNESGASTEAFSKMINRAGLRMSDMAGEIGISNKGLTFYSEAAARAAGLSVPWARAQGLIVEKLEKANPLYKAYNKLVQDLGNYSAPVSQAIQQLSEKFGKSDIAVSKWGGALRESVKGMEAKRQAMISAGKDGQAYIDNAKAIAIQERIQAGQMAAAPEGFKRIASASKAAIDSQNKGFSSYASTMNSAISDNQSYAQTLNEIAKMYPRGTAGNKMWVKALNDAENIIQKVGMRMNEAGRNGEAFIRNTDRGSVATDLFNGALKKTADGAAKAGDNLSGHGKAVANATKMMAPFNSEAVKQETVLGRLGSTIKSMAYWGVAASLVYGMINTFKKGVSEVIAFDQALKNLQAIVGSTDAETAALGETMKTLAKTTRYSTDDIAKGMVYLGQAGLTAAESMQTIKAVTTLAGGTLEDLSKTADLVTTVMRSFELSAGDSARIADVLAAAANRSKLDIEKLRVAFGYVGPAASEAGMSLEETAAASMILADSGLRASTIGTSLRQMLARLLTPTEKMRRAFKDAGAEIERINPETNSFKDVLGELAKVTTNASVAFSLFGLRAAPAAIILTRAISDGNAAYAEALKSVFELGNAQKMFDKQMEGLGARFSNLASKLSVLTVGMGDGGLKGVLETFVDTMRFVVDEMIAFSNTIGGQYVISMGAAVGVTFAFIKLLQALKFTTFLMSILEVIAAGSVLATVWSKVTAVIGAIVLHPIIALLLGLAGAIGAVVLAGSRMRNQPLKLGAEAEEFLRVEDNLKKYKATLTTTAYNSEEYRSTIRRLAKEHPELGKHIDIVTGKFRDEATAIQALNDLTKAQHVEALKKQIEAMQALSGQMKVTFSNIFLTRTDNILTKLFQSSVQLAGQFKEFGIDTKSSVEEVQAALSNLFPTATPEKLAEMTNWVNTGLNIIREKEVEAEKEKQEEKLKIIRGTRKKVPEVMESMYEDLRGARRADAEDLREKLAKDLKAMKDKFGDEETESEAAAGRKVELEMNTIDKLAELNLQGTGSEDDINRLKLVKYKELLDQKEALAFNERMKITERYNREYAAAEGNAKKQKSLNEAYNTQMFLIYRKYKGEVEAMAATMNDRKMGYDKDYEVWFQEHINRLLGIHNQFLAQTSRGGMDAGAGLLPSSAVTNAGVGGTSLRSKEDQAAREGAQWEKKYKDFSTIIRKYSGQWADTFDEAWNNASSYQKSVMVKLIDDNKKTLDALPNQFDAAKGKIEEEIGGWYKTYQDGITKGESELLAIKEKLLSLEMEFYSTEASATKDKYRKAELEYQIHILKMQKTVAEAKLYSKTIFPLQQQGFLSRPENEGFLGTTPLVNMTELYKNQSTVVADVIRIAIETAARETGMDPSWIYAIMRRETGGRFNPTADNKKGYYGLGQFSVETAREVLRKMGYEKSMIEAEQDVIALAFDPNVASQMIARYLVDLNKQYKGNTKAAFGQYIGAAKFKPEATGPQTPAQYLDQEFAQAQAFRAKSIGTNLTYQEQQQLIDKRGYEARARIDEEYKDKIEDFEQKDYDKRVAAAEREMRRATKTKGEALRKLFALDKLAVERTEDRADRARGQYSLDLEVVDKYYNDLRAIITNNDRWEQARAAKQPTPAPFSNVLEAKDQATAMVNLDQQIADKKAFLADQLQIRLEKISEQKAKHEKAAEDREIAAIDHFLDARKAEADIQTNLDYIQSLNHSKTLQDMLDADYKYNQDRVNDYAEAMALIEEYLPKGSDAYNLIMARMAKGMRTATEAAVASEKRAFEERNSNAEYYYRIGELSATDYANFLKKLWMFPFTPKAERQAAWDKYVTEFGTMGDRIALGFRRAKASVQSFGEVVVGITTELPDQFASGFTSAFREFADGTKTMAQAWQDFSRNMLWWIGEILIKWAALKALTGVNGTKGAAAGEGMGWLSALASGIGSLFGFSTSGGLGYDKALGSYGFGNVPFHHSGGIVGLDTATTKMVLASAFNNAQRMHGGGIVGLKPDEKAIVAKNREGVFTEDQMKALAPAVAQHLNITNITDPRMIDAYLATPSGKRSIINVIGTEANNVRLLLRTA